MRWFQKLRLGYVLATEFWVLEYGIPGRPTVYCLQNYSLTPGDLWGLYKHWRYRKAGRGKRNLQYRNLAVLTPRRVRGRLTADLVREIIWANPTPPPTPTAGKASAARAKG